MQQSSFEVVLDSFRTDAFVEVSTKFVDDALRPFYGNNIPTVVPLKIFNGKKEVYVGCLVHRPHNLQSCKLVLSVVLGRDLELNDGETVQCVPVYNSTKAARVTVVPASVDESEVVEQNALHIEAQLLRQVQVVFPSMKISVVVFAGVQARLTVQRIEDPQGRETMFGCAVMSEGTEFIIATRKRQLIESGMPMWCVLRAHSHAFSSSENATTKTEAEVLFLVCSVTAKRYNWTEGLVMGFWDLACMSQLLKDKKVTPSFIRSNAWKAPLRFDDNLSEGICSCIVFHQASNVIVFPNPDENVPSLTNNDSKFSCFSSRFSDKVYYEEVVAVHGEAPRELQRHLTGWFFRKRGLNSDCIGSVRGGNGNVLLCGGKGYGKTALLSATLGELRDIHVCVVHYTSNGKQLLSSLQEALVESAMCAPSVLILDDFAAMAPAQQEGSVISMSSTTKSMMEEVLQCFTDILTLSGRSSVAVIATCVNREDINERLRSASCFAKVIKLEALDKRARTTLLQQLFPKESMGILEEFAGLMDNYTPFDIKRVSARIKGCCRDGRLTSTEVAKEVIACFTPLSHTGINFLKSQKLSLDSVGGLTVAKKALYNTLVFPIKHSELFARLPLKTRSGILLYGPSGCGKTFLVEAVVSAANLNCIVVNGPEVFGKYIGQSEQKIRDVFERAQAAAPCVIFFDEFDSVAPQRGGDNSGVTDRVVNQLLCYLDGVEGRKDVYVVAASSRPDLIDAALLRPGRLDKAVECPIPSFEERLEILMNCFKRVEANLTRDEIEDLAKQTTNWTPADLSGLVSSANLFVSRRVIEKFSLGVELEQGTGSDFAVLNVGKGTTQEKIEDTLKPIFDTAKQKRILDLSIPMGIEDVKQALAVTRPSLTRKDILKYEKIRRCFAGQEKENKLSTMGKKLTLQ